MNRALQEMLHCLHSPENLVGNNLDMSLLERQRARLKWQQQQQQQQQEQELQQQQSEQPQQSFFNETQFNVFSLPDPITETQQFQALLNNDLALRELVNRSMKADPGLENGWLDLGRCPIPRTGFVGEEPGFVSSGFATNPAEMNYPLSRTSSSPPEMAVEKGRGSEKMGSAVGRESFKKRKSDKAQSTKVIAAEDTRDKRMKGDVEEVESKVIEENSNNNNNREASADTSKENSKVSEVQKPDYIHVRARRGQATDSHSLAERVRREKISERMKYLQDLVPGCNKITGKAGMLDEIINYVQSLQRQVEFLSMKLAAVNPRLDFNIDNFFAKEVFPACTGDFPTVGMSSEMANPTFLQFNPVQQVVSGCGLDMGINPSDITLGRSSTSAPVSAPETFLDSSCFTQQAQAQPSSSNWDNDLQSLYNVEFQQGRSNLFPFQPFTGTMEANNLKMEM